MNAKQLERAVRELTELPWSPSGPALYRFGKAVGAEPAELLAWHRKGHVPSAAANRISSALRAHAEEHSSMESQHQPEPRAVVNATGGGREPLTRTAPPSVAIEEVELFNPNDDAIRLWQIDQALQHLTRNAGILGLGANVVQQSLRQERAEVVERLSKLAEQLMVHS